MNEKIFVSYNRQDSEFALKLADDLVAQGINIWIDQRNIAAGFRWDHEIQKALSNAEVVLVILSPHSVASENVLDEVSFAIEAKKRIIPIIARQCDIPLRLKRFQYIEFNRNYSSGLNKLLAELKQGQVPPLPDAREQDDPFKDKQKKTKILKYFLIGLGVISVIIIIWLLTNNQRDPGPGPLPVQPAQINVSCSAIPNSIQPGDQAELRVSASTPRGELVSNAIVKIEMDGGWFSVSGNSTEHGTTNADGIFITRWKSPKPAAAGYGVSVTVSKEGFIEGKCETRIDIKKLTMERGPAARPSITEQINVTCAAKPDIIPAGGESELSVKVTTSQGNPISNAKVKIEIGGGRFSMSGTANEVGITNANGIFETIWKSPDPTVAGYGVSVTVNKDGFLEGKCKARIDIEKLTNQTGPDRQLIKEQIIVNCSANPNPIRVLGQEFETELSILASTPKGVPISNANVRIEINEGYFSVSGTATEIGTTNENGVFVTKWRPPGRVGPKYGVSVTVNKEGFIEGKRETTIYIGN